MTRNTKVNALCPVRLPPETISGGFSHRKGDARTGDWSPVWNKKTPALLNTEHNQLPQGAALRQSSIPASRPASHIYIDIQTHDKHATVTNNTTTVLLTSYMATLGPRRPWLFISFSALNVGFSSGALAALVRMDTSAHCLLPMTSTKYCTGGYGSPSRRRYMGMQRFKLPRMCSFERIRAAEIVGDY